MAGNYYFKDRTGAQNGPVSFEELLAVARSGRIAPDCLVWPEGGDPVAARDIPELAAATNAPFGALAAGAAAPNAAASALQADFPPLGLFWRSLVAGLGLMFVIPAPWLATWFYTWTTERVRLPNGARLTLDPPALGVSLLFVGFALSIVAPALYAGIAAADDPGAADRADVATLRMIGSAAEMVCSYLILRWFVGAVRSADGALAISFDGGFWAFLGWNLLLGLSVLTLIGWAWVARFMARWICRNISGSHAFDFIGAGIEILWRTLLVAFGCLLILPAPWLIAWYYNWMVSQIVATPRKA
ncbi:hypothetical protein M2322_002749 [Rhodoblastus acidophilus]|uniref:DUF4339 domain-containing protein n=1 Tax=Rhodoblastus acidophilus TaxID=1074 RepID=UPI00222459B7|nr:DUF4339 domain-containing protein [Rhodoblastus acidophilus]MCW2317195.1 hypothetical protein [Rhodoblastus acidophilus]